MGYDMYLRQVPEHLRGAWEKNKELEQRWWALSDRPRGDPEAAAACKALEAHEDPTYFRVSVYGLSAFRQVMGPAGMVVGEHRFDREHAPIAPIPTVLVRGVDGVERHYEDQDSPEHMAMREYRHEGTLGIALWKLFSNDGWFVTAEECSEALAAWDRLTADEQRSMVMEGFEAVRGFADFGSAEKARKSAELGVPVEQLAAKLRQRDDEFWSEWLAWLRLAADGTGFVVW